MSEQEYNDGHKVEALQVCHMTASSISDHLLDHPAVKKADCRLKVEVALNLINACYQDIGNIE